MRDLLAEDRARTERTIGAAALALREKRSGTSTFSEPAEWLMQVFGTQSKAGSIVNENSALTVATFGACVNILASALSTPPLRLMKRTPRGAVPCDGQPDGHGGTNPLHPLHFLVNHEPNGVQTSYRWRSFRTACLCLGGNAYTQIKRNGYFEVEELKPMVPFRVQPRALAGAGDWTGEIVYRFEGRELKPWEVLHNRGLSTDGFFGISPIRALRESLGLALTMQEFTARTFNNGTRKPGLFEGGPTTTREKATEFLQFWQQNYGGAMNAGKTPVLFGGMSWKDAGFSNDDAQLLLMKNFEKSEICQWFLIPEVLLGNTDKTSSWGTGIEKIMFGFVEFCLRPWARNDEQELDRALLTKEEKLAGYFFQYSFAELLQGTPADQANFLKTLWQIGAKTSNEVRRHFGDVELPDGPANKRYVPTTFVPDDAPLPLKQPTGAPAGNPDEKE